MGLRDASFKYHRCFDYPFCCHDANTCPNGIKLLGFEYLLCQRLQRCGLLMRRSLLHYARHMSFVEIVNSIYSEPQRDKSRDDGTRTRAKNQIETFAQWAINQALDLTQHSKRIEAL